MAIKYSALNLVLFEKVTMNEQQLMIWLSSHNILDELSYERYWIAEHHNAPNLVSSATAFINSTYVRTYETHTCRFWRNHVT